VSVAENKKTSIGGKSSCHLLNIKQPERTAKRLKLTFRRTRATVNVLKADRAVDASISLMDVSEAGAGVFTQDLLLKGSTVELCLTEPKILKLKALVAWSVPIVSGIQSTRFPFRSGLQFVFENETQRATLLEFIQKMNLDPIENFKPSQNGAEPATGMAPPVAGSEAPAADLAAGEVKTEGAVAEAAPAQTPPEAIAAAPVDAPADAAAGAPVEAPAAEAPQESVTEAPTEAAPTPAEGDGEPQAA